MSVALPRLAAVDLERAGVVRLKVFKENGYLLASDPRVDSGPPGGG
jgi:hypothetical protein